MSNWTLRFTFNPDQPIFDQIVFSATKAFVSGQMQPGDAFPSVRMLAAELKINPNTAAKVVQHLIGEGWLEATPGKGTVVSHAPRPKADGQRQLLEKEIEQLAVEGKRVGLTLEDVTDALAAHWQRLDGGGKANVV